MDEGERGTGGRRSKHTALRRPRRGERKQQKKDWISVRGGPDSRGQSPARLSASIRAPGALFCFSEMNGVWRRFYRGTCRL